MSILRATRWSRTAWLQATTWLLAFASALLICTVAWYTKDVSLLTRAPFAVTSDAHSTPQWAPRKHVYFLKTHKCASTTVQRVILAYGLRNNLSFALPMSRSNNFYPRPYSPQIAKRTAAYPRFDVMAAHARYHPSAKRYMPADTTFVSIVRDPADQMESAFYYYYRRKCPVHAGKSFDAYVAGLPANAQQADGGDGGGPVRYRLPCDAADLRFMQLYDLGLDLGRFPTRERVAEHIRELDRSFHLVLLVERIDEGLLLLRDLLGWTTEDVVYLRSNSRVRRGSAMSNATRERAHAWNWADKMLYDHFKAKFEDAVRQRADRVRRELDDFRRRLESFYDFCVESVAAARLGAQRAKSVQMSSYVLSERGERNASCRVAAMTELDLFDRINSLRPRYSSRRAAAARRSQAVVAAAVTGGAQRYDGADAVP